MPRAEDIGKLIGRGLKFAAGAAFAPSADVADAGTPGSISKAPTIGQRVRGGVSAISPGFREFEELGRSKAISSAEFNQIQEETRITREQDRRDNEPLFFEDFTKGLGKRNKAEFDRRLTTEGLMREQGGKKYVLRGELRGRVDKLDDEPDEKIEIATNEILDFKETIGDLELRKNKEIEKLLNERKKLTESGHTFNESARDYENRLRSNQPGSLLVQTANEEIAGLNTKTKGALIEIETQRDILRKGKAETPKALSKLEVTRSAEFDRDLSGVQGELDGDSSIEEKGELILKLVDFYKGQRNEIIQQLRLSHPEVMNALGFGTRRDTGERTP